MLKRDVEDTIRANNCDSKSVKRGFAGWHLLSYLQERASC